MDPANPNPQPAPTPAPIADPPPAAPVVEPPAPPMPAPIPSYQTGGSPGSGGVKKFFEGVTLSDVVIMGLSFLALFFMINFYRKKLLELKEQRATKSELEQKVEELTSNVKTLMGENYQSAT